MKKLLFLIIIILFNFKLVLAIDLENLSEATEELEEIQKEISDIKSSNSETAKTIDEAIKEINKATEFVKKTLKSNNVEDAINTLEFIEKSLSDVTNLIPPKITSGPTIINGYFLLSSGSIKFLYLFSAKSSLIIFLTILYS